MLKFKRPFIIAIDGPAASGKSSTAKELAKLLNIIYLDTGAMYRAVTYYALKNNIPINDYSSLENLTKNLTFKFINQGDTQRILVNDEDITKEIRTKLVSDNVSDYCAVPVVREILVTKQREFAKNNSCILDGRDIGTVVFPNADFKFYFVASPEVRAKRRFEELKKAGIEADYNDILRNILERDKKDSSRSIAPLKKADDAIEIDTSHLTFDEQVNMIYDIILKGLNEKGIIED